MVTAPCDSPHNIHHKLLKLQSMMDPLSHPHVESDMVHNFAHVFFILDHLDLSTIKPQKVKPSSHTK
jgi:hypothetical protein